MNYVSMKTISRYLIAHKLNVIFILIVSLLLGLTYAHLTKPEVKTAPKLTETAKVQIYLNEEYKDSLSTLRSINETFPQLATKDTWEAKVLIFLSPVDPQRLDKLTSLYYGIQAPANLLTDFNSAANFEYSRYQFNRLWSYKLVPEENTIIVSTYGATEKAANLLTDSIIQVMKKRQADSLIPHQLILVDRISRPFNKKEILEQAKIYFDNAQKTRRELLYPTVQDNLEVVPNDNSNRYVTYGAAGVILGVTLVLLVALFRSLGKPKYFSLTELKNVGYPIEGVYYESSKRMSLDQIIMNDLKVEEKNQIIDRTFIQLKRKVGDSDLPITLLYQSGINVEEWISKSKEFNVHVHPVNVDVVPHFSHELIKEQPMIVLLTNHELLSFGEKYLDLLPKNSTISVVI